MKLSISNIGWPQEKEEDVLKFLSETSFSAIEIAPSRIWPDFRRVESGDRKRYMDCVHSYGMTICSMHSLYYGMNDMNMFGDQCERRQFIDFTMELVRFASDLEIPRMILGSPPIRKKGNFSDDKAVEMASDVLNPLADYAVSNGTKILIEALAPEETDFINTHNEALLLVKAVNSKGFGLHLDAKAISVEPDDYETIFRDCDGQVEHFHANESKLAGFDSPKLDHQQMADCLCKIGYNGYVSIEMRQQQDYMKAVMNAVGFVEKIYGSVTE